MIVIDGKNAILGRLSSYVAKQALKGHDVAVLNCENVLVSGNSKMVLEQYREMRAKGGSAQKGPYFPRSPARIVKRTIRGMLPHMQERGKTALKRVMCYDDLPEKYKNEKHMHIKSETHAKTMTLKKLSEEL